jgi:hypothetical protein
MSPDSPTYGPVPDRTAIPDMVGRVEFLRPPQRPNGGGTSNRRLASNTAQTYDLTVGWLYPGDPQATTDSQRIYRHLTAGDLWHRLIEAGVPTHIAAEANGRTTLPGGMQLTWTRTTDTTGETR